VKDRTDKRYKTGLGKGQTSAVNTATSTFQVKRADRAGDRITKESYRSARHEMPVDRYREARDAFVDTDSTGEFRIIREKQQGGTMSFNVKEP